MKKIITGITCLFITIFGSIAFSQNRLNPNFNNSLITARVIMADGSVIEGIFQLWDAHVTPIDIFYAFQTSNENARLVSSDLLKQRKNYRKQRVNWFFGIPLKKSVLANYQPPFQCSFHYIKRFDIQKDKVLITLINNQKYSLVSKRGILNSDVTIDSELLGKKKIKWKNIKAVEFIYSDHKIGHEKGALLYGKVETNQGGFTGYIKWNQHDRFDAEFFEGKLNGKTVRFPYRNIQSIAKTENGCALKLINGDFYNLTPNPFQLLTDYGIDVGNDNRGISITNNQIGCVTVRWDDFIKINFLKGIDSLVNFRCNSADSIKPITATVISSENISYHGYLKFNLSKELNIEFLSGFDSNGLYYEIPFSLIQSIRIGSTNSSLIKLIDDTVIELFNGKEIDYRNDGVIIIQKSDFKYLSWDCIREIIIK